MQHTTLFSFFLCLLGPAAAAQWSIPAPVRNVNSRSGEFDPSPTSDGLTLYFASSSSSTIGYANLFRAVRAAPYGTFGPAIRITELASGANDAGPCARIDDLELFFSSERPGGGGGSIDLWRAARSSVAMPFQAPVPVTELNTLREDASPCLTADGLRLYFASTRSGSMGGYDLWTATRPNWTSPFGTPTPVTELNTSRLEVDPHVTSDGLVIFFTSDRAPGLRGGDLWMASRLAPGAPFGNIVNVTALNSSADDYAPGFSRFHDEIFFTSIRPGGPGAFDIYSSRFTGLGSVGVAGPGSVRDVRFADPSSPGLAYLAISSGGNSPGIPIDTRVLPLNFDLVFQLTVGGLPPILSGYAGALDGNGVAAGRISFLGFPQFVGLRFFSAFVVLDAASVSGIRTISNAHEVQVQ